MLNLITTTLLQILTPTADRLPHILDTPIAPAPIIAHQLIELVSVIDGDTFRAKYGNEIVKLRIACGDAPESKQRLGKWAREQLINILSKGTLTAEFVGTSYDRKVVNVYVNGRSAMVELAKRGAALPYSTYKGSCKEDWGDVLDSARTAKAAKVGVYSDPVDVPGWEFRSAKLGKVRVLK
jgi:endonuclease YncB( thermonuclease family)